MNFHAPTTVSEVAADGLVRQRWVDSLIPQLIGPVVATEVSHTSDHDAEVRFGRQHGPDLTFPATRVANVTEDGWQWTSLSMQEAAERFNLPELWGSVGEEHPDFIGAARTLHGGMPILRATMPGGDTAILAVWLTLPPHGPETPLLTAAGLSGRPVDAYLATNPTEAILRDGALYDLPGNMLLDDIRADAWHLSAEHQLLYDALVPHPGTYLDLATGCAHLTTTRGPLSANATVVATVTDDQWTWSWADPHLVRTPHAHAGQQLLEFGQHQLLPALCTPTLPVKCAQQWNLDIVVKPILRSWTHAFIPITADTYAVTLLSHPELQLPPLTPEVRAAVLAQNVPAPLSAERAQQFYDAARS